MPDVQDIKIGLIGCGGMGKALVTNVPTIPGAKLIAVSDVDVDRARSVAEEFQAEAFGDYRKMLERDNLDAVVVASPNFLHAEMTVAAAEAGKHVFCEKPMAMNVEQCDAMIAAADKAKVKLMIGQVLRYYPHVAWMISQATSGRYGAPCSANIIRIGGGFGKSPLGANWRLQRATMGNVMLEVSVHELDFIRTVMGKPIAVTAWFRRFLEDGPDYDDTIYMIVEFENNRVVHLLSGFSSAIGCWEAKLFFDKGSIFCNGWGEEIQHRTFEEESVNKARVSELWTNNENPVHQEVRLWVEAIQNDTPAPVPGSEGRANIEIIEAAEISSREKRRIELPLR